MAIPEDRVAYALSAAGRSGDFVKRLESRSRRVALDLSGAAESARRVRVRSAIKRRACGLPDAAAESRSPAGSRH